MARDLNTLRIWLARNTPAVLQDRSTLVIYAALLLALAASAWLAGRAQRQAAQLELGAARDVDYYLRGMTATTLDPQGRVRDELHVARLVHYKGRAGAALAAPRLTRHRPSGPPLRIEARQGWADDGNAVLEFTGAVRVHTRRTAESAPVEARMTKLSVFPQRDLATTDGAVTLQTAGAELTGTGLEIFGSEGRVVIKSRVRSRLGSAPPSAAENTP